MTTRSKRFAKILWAGLTCILMTVTGCAATQALAPCSVTKPRLPSITRNDLDGMCINRSDTEALMTYIVELEACVK